MTDFYNPAANFASPSAIFGSDNIDAGGSAAEDLGIATGGTGGSAGGLFGEGTTASDAASTVGAVASGITDMESAGMYREAAQTFEQEKAVVGENVNINRFQLGRQLNLTLGAQSAQLAAAGVSGQGSGQYLARQAVAQSGIAVGKMRVQGAIEEAALQEQSDASNAQATMATTSGIGSFLKGAIGIAATIGKII